MSYEGFTELLCANGHYYSHDVYYYSQGTCPACGAAFAYRHSVDQTNGYEYEDYDADGEGIGDPLPYTTYGPKEEIGFDDDWRLDHYGNKYAIKIPRYKPGEHWVKLK